VFNVSLQIVN